MDDVAVLNKIKNVCFTKDTRAVWFGIGKAETNIDEFKATANWSNQHMTMYKHFYEYIVGEDLTCLDVGCGVGFCTINTKTDNKNIKIFDAIDYDSCVIDLANANNCCDGVSYLCSDFFEYTTDKKYDYIFALEILEHISSDNHFSFVDKCLSLISDTGKIFISTPNEPDGVDVGHHRGVLNKGRYKKFLERYSSNIIDIFYSDNKVLDFDSPNESVIIGTVNEFDVCDGKNRSHFSFVLGR